MLPSFKIYQTTRCDIQMGYIKISLEDVMKNAGMTNRALAEKLGITEVHISRIKHENIKSMRLDTLYALCDVLDCEPGDLLKKVD